MKKLLDIKSTYTAGEIIKTLTYMMTHELSHRSTGLGVDQHYIDGFINRLFQNIEDDRIRAGMFPAKEIIDAWNNGQRIQAKRKDGDNQRWFDLFTKDECFEIIWHAHEYEYRVKPVYEKEIKPETVVVSPNKKAI